MGNAASVGRVIGVAGGSAMVTSLAGMGQNYMSSEQLKGDCPHDNERDSHWQRGTIRAKQVR